jgi:hypothetical protein
MLQAPEPYGRVMIRALLPRLGLAALLCAAAAPALAQQTLQSAPQQRSRTPVQLRPEPAQAQPQRAATAQKPAAGEAKPAGPGGAQATLLASFSDWGAYASGQGRSRICYALSQPKERLPADLKRDPAYLFVSFRPAENVRNEIAVVMGFATRDGAAAAATIGDADYALITKGPNAWVRNPAEENQVIAAFTRGRDVTIKATSARGNTTTDRYSLIGFTQALDRARKECS